MKTKLFLISATFIASTNLFYCSTQSEQERLRQEIVRSQEALYNSKIEPYHANETRQPSTVQPHTIKNSRELELEGVCTWTCEKIEECKTIITTSDQGKYNNPATLEIIQNLETIVATLKKYPELNTNLTEAINLRNHIIIKNNLKKPLCCTIS